MKKLLRKMLGPSREEREHDDALAVRARRRWHIAREAMERFPYNVLTNDRNAMSRFAFVNWQLERDCCEPLDEAECRVLEGEIAQRRDYLTGGFEIFANLEPAAKVKSAVEFTNAHLIAHKFLPMNDAELAEFAG